MTFFPDGKTFVQIGSFSIAWYAICIIAGAIIAYKILRKWVLIEKFYLIIFMD